MNFLNTVNEATLTDAVVSVASGNGSISMKEALSTSITGIAVVMIILAILAVLVVILSKLVRTVEAATKKKDNKANVQAAPEKPLEKQISNGTALPDTQSAGKLDLYKIDEKTAAVIMAIVSNESGIPLNRLQFNSIKLIEK